MTSTAPLPPDLLILLLSGFTTPFALTAQTFRQRIPESEHFLRICELHNTLEVLTLSSEPVVDLRLLREGSRPGSGRSPVSRRVNGNGSSGVTLKQDAEDLLAFMLNAEFVLWQMYAEFDIALNPNLSHWVGLCRSFEGMRLEDCEEEGVEGIKWGIKESIFKIRTAFVKGILGGKGPMVCLLYSPRGGG